MNIVILEGSPNKNGSSNILADCFRQGAEEAGYKVEIIDAAHDKAFRIFKAGLSTGELFKIVCVAEGRSTEDKSHG